jgi:predicted GNAT family acetyltransferase
LAVSFIPRTWGWSAVSALVAALSDEGLRRGKEFCILYTDLANPTANAIYQAIGYRPVSRSKRIRFQYA